MPYELETTLRSAHCISAEDAELAAMGNGKAEAFVRHYGKSERARWQKLIVPFREDPFEGRSLWTGTGNAPDYVYRAHPRRGRGELFTEYENVLRKCGLGWNVNGGDAQHVIVAKESTPPLAYVKDAPIQLERKYAIKDGASVVPINVHEREIPAWTASDENIRAYILHVCPHLNDSKRSRRRAAAIVATAYLWFRTMLSAEEIATELGLTAEQVINRAGHIRKHGARFFSPEGCDCRARRAA